MISLTIPLATKSEANMREHFRTVAKRKKDQRGIVHLKLGPMIRGRKLQAACVVTLTRISPRELDDDNLASSFKAIRDQVAAELGIDDRNPIVKWEYGQEKNRARGIRIEIRRRAA